MNFATQLRQLRTGLGLSQARAAELLGVTTNTIKNWEAERRQPPDDPILSKQQILQKLQSAGDKCGWTPK